MAEISQIVQSILHSAEKEAEEIINRSKSETNHTITELRRNHEARIKEIETEENIQTDMINKRFEHESRVILSNAVSVTRLAFFETVINDAKQKIKDLPEKEYCVFIDEQISHKNPKPNSVISFGSGDLKKVSKKFIDEIIKKYRLTVGKPFEGYGFIINGDTFSEISTVDSLFDDNKTEILSILRRFEETL